jgi:hypothetical protein
MISLKPAIMKAKSVLACALTLTFVIALLLACKKKDSSSGSSSATITALTCSGAAFSTTPAANTAYTGTATVPYTGGNGGSYSAGSAIASTGVTGLTATLAAGTLSSGDGMLTYNITGTPSGTGTAAFAISFSGQSCSMSVTVNTGTVSECSSLSGVAKVVCLAEAFKATLSSTQIASLQIAYTHANAIKWSNLPGGVTIRNGIEFSTLNATQLAAAKAVIAAASGTTANEGYDEFTQINAADDVLAATAGSGYSSGKYIIAFLGEPSTTGNWILQFGGHHYAQNICYQAGTVAGATPSHQGIEPTSWTSNGTTFAPLLQEKTAMADMLASFTTAQLASAKTSTTFSDVLLGPSKDGQFPSTKVGIQVSTLSSASQAKVLAAMMPWLNDLDSATTAAVLAIYTGDLANTYVTYANNPNAASGNTSSFFTTNTDYVRIDGPRVWIEFVCQTGVVYSSQIHYHAVFRDHTSDYGGL